MTAVSRLQPDETCGICGAPYLAPFLDLGMQPLAEQYGDHQDRYPLRLVRCQSCTLVQLAKPWPDQRVLFPDDHPYATGDTEANRAHFMKLAVTAGWRLRPGDLVADIGANDGTFLSMFDQGIVKIAVEPTGQAARISDDVHGIYREFFTSGLAQRIRLQYGPAKLVTASNVLAHVPDPHDFMSGVMTLLADDGEFVTENHDLRSVVTGLQIDTVYHEHLRYYDLTSLGRLLSMHGLAVTGVMHTEMHGGSFRVTARRVAAGNLQQRADAVRYALWKMVAELKADGSRIYGISAATRATPLIWFSGIADYLDCVCETEGSAKIGRTMPGTDLPIVPDSRLIADQPEYAMLFCWHIADTVVPKLRAAGYRGKFIVPLPEPEVLDG